MLTIWPSEKATGGVYEKLYPSGIVFISGDIGTPSIHILRLDKLRGVGSITSIDIGGDAKDITISSGYAYVADATGALKIIDISPLDSAYLAHTIEMPSGAVDVHVSDGYAYVSDMDGGLRIVDLW